VVTGTSAVLASVLSTVVRNGSLLDALLTWSYLVGGGAAPIVFWVIGIEGYRRSLFGSRRSGKLSQTFAGSVVRALIWFSQQESASPWERYRSSTSAWSGIGIE
jgi:hypothetical protein